ncbi:YitT family protein [Flavivirga amylovorans]|uniref:YitT family protein n=1 Tax=Flavivirga amylovorans TaxID=870486 RepID=A0ABT8X6W7_9FLAO|nr:YitT family protein [Flavivirga amylovorans]MDO5989731.1 YitT family protein [Flavivirga amylovorans]
MTKQPTKDRNRMIRNTFEYLKIALGVLLASIGLKAFLLPNGFLDGGVTGIAILLNTQFDVNMSLILLLISIPFLILAYFTISRYMFFKSLISIISLAVFIHFENFQVITNDKLLISIFGGLFLGLGIGITIKNGAVLDGSEILGIYLNRHFGISIGKVILIFNFILFAITAIIFSKETAMYSILAFLVTAKITDLTIEGFENFIGVMIVSKKYEQVKEAITSELRSGMTVFNGIYGYGNQGVNTNFEVIYTIINRIEIGKINKIIDQIDPHAFVIEYDINHIKGGVLRRYLSNKEKHALKILKV